MSKLLKIFCCYITKLNSRKMSLTTKTMEPVKIAVGQMNATNDKCENMNQVKELVSLARTKNAKFLFLPECCDFVAENRAQTLELAEPLTGVTMDHYKELAKCNDMWLSLGGIHELIQDAHGCSTGKVFNAHVVVNNKGKIVSVYRKMHLFDAQTKDFKFKESNTVEYGKCIEQPLETPIGLLGLLICYDIRFAEAALILRNYGAQILTYPAAFTYPTGKAHWEILLRARAIETQCFVIAAAQQGWHNSKRQSWGHAMVIDPWGTVLADCGGENSLAIEAVDIDLNKLQPIYNSIPCFTHRRDDIYSLTVFNEPLKEITQDRLFADKPINKNTIFFESKYSFAFTNIRCVVEGHVLVSPKRITPRLNGLEVSEMTDLFVTVCRIQRTLEKYYNTTSATVTVQDGEKAGQTVPHVHFHIMPRRDGDFGENDQIYTKLEDYVKDNTKDRTIDQRIEEAKIYRDFIRVNYCK